MEAFDIPAPMTRETRSRAAVIAGGVRLNREIAAIGKFADFGN
jgi:hypothetical protein